MKSNDLMEDWSLHKFEEHLAKDGTKALFICSEEIFNKTHTFYHTNGMSFVVLKKYKTTFNELNATQLDKFGIRKAVIGASCEHPPFYTWTYDGYCSSSYHSSKDALNDYLLRNPQLDLKMKEEYFFVECKFYRYSLESKLKRDQFDQERLDRPWKE